MYGPAPCFPRVGYCRLLQAYQVVPPSASPLPVGPLPGSMGPLMASGLLALTGTAVVVKRALDQRRSRANTCVC